MAEQSSLLSHNWTDILPPQSPASPLLWWILASVLLLFLVLLVVWILRRQAPRQRARRVIDHCRQQLTNAGVDTRRLAAQVYSAMLDGLALSPATAHLHTAADWQAFYSRIERCVFRPQPPSADELATLFAQARDWLYRFPT